MAALVHQVSRTHTGEEHTMSTCVRPRLISVLFVLAVLPLPTRAAGTGATWPMAQGDPQHTGRASFSVPESRRNALLFDIALWQTPTGEEASSGWVTSTQMTFFDGAGPGGADLVLGTYHWPKGVAGLDRHDGRVLWSGNPSGGETIGNVVPAFAPDGATVYVTNDSTQTGEWPGGTPLMAFSATAGPGTFRHNGGDADPADLEATHPVISPDGRIFMHRALGVPAAGVDDGASIHHAWIGTGPAVLAASDVSLFQRADGLQAVAVSRDGRLVAWDASSGAIRWAVDIPGGDATPTIDPQNGNVYAAIGEGDVYVAGVNASGQALWGSPSVRVYQYVEGSNDPARVASAGCLSWDRATYYLQTVTNEGTGRLYAIATATGAVRWSYDTQAAGWDIRGSAPIVTQDGTVVVGNDLGRTYYALHDDGTHATLLDTLVVSAPGEARASASLAPDGLLYLPAQVVWRAGNGNGQAPTYRAEKLFNAFDLSAGAVQQLWPPGNQRALARNHAVLVKWVPVVDTSGQFAHYAIYRATAPFASVDGLAPLATVPGSGSASYLDTTAANGTAYWYAVTTVPTAGVEHRNVAGCGPRTPHDETDLQVVTIERTPRFPRYAPWYEDHTAIDPGGFGPYWYSAAMGLSEGQTSETPRWPAPGTTVTYTATIRNRGTNTWSGALPSEWSVDGVPLGGSSAPLTLAPGATASFTLQRTWDGGLHDVRFAMTPQDARAGNDALTIDTKSVPFLTYLDETYAENFREDSAEHPQAATDDIVDWLNRHMARFNALFAAAGSPKRVHYGVLRVLEDGDADPADPPTLDYGVFPFRFRATEDNLRHISGWYVPEDDIDFGLLHEEGHQLGLIDVYQLNLAPEQNLVSGLPYSAPPCLMNACSGFLSPHSAGAMTHWRDQAHGYFGQYLYQLPEHVAFRFLGADGAPLAGATVTLYQMAERPDMGKVVAEPPKAQGTTDANGVWILPNVPIDPALVPPAATGDALHDNPFGYVAVVGHNGLLHARIERDGYTDWAWLDITEVNTAYWAGATTLATFERTLHLGGPILHCLPDDMTENNAAAWSAWADGGTASATDDASFKVVGAASLRAETNGGFDSLWRYPGGLGRFDLGAATHFRFWAWHVNDHGFQSGSPWIVLRGAAGYIELHPTWDILSLAYGQWTHFAVPLAGDETWIRTDHGAVSLDAIDAIEIHADTWDYGFTLWLDGVGFDPPQPGEVSGVMVTPGQLAWAATPLASSYDVVRGSAAGLRTNDFGACLATGVTGTSWGDTARPAPGAAFTYLVRATAPSCGRTGTWGAASDGTPRVNVNPAGCP